MKNVIGGFGAIDEVRITPHQIVKHNHGAESKCDMFVGLSAGEAARYAGQRFYVSKLVVALNH